MAELGFGSLAPKLTSTRLHSFVCYVYYIMRIWNIGHILSSPDSFKIPAEVSIKCSGIVTRIFPITNSKFAHDSCLFQRDFNHNESLEGGSGHRAKQNLENDEWPKKNQCDLGLLGGFNGHQLKDLVILYEFTSYTNIYLWMSFL